MNRLKLTKLSECLSSSGRLSGRHSRTPDNRTEASCHWGTWGTCPLPRQYRDCG